MITPREPAERGCQLSILVHEHPRKLHEELVAAARAEIAAAQAG